MHVSPPRNYLLIDVEVGHNRSESAKPVLHQYLRRFVRQMAR
jgi:hypothetical protein